MHVLLCENMKGEIRLEQFLKEIEKEKGMLPKDLHITRMCCALVAVSNGKVIKVTEPGLKYCPLASSLYKLFETSSLKEEIAGAVMANISDFGFFTNRRELCRKSVAIPYGASEMMMYALEKGGIDASVIVCDGAGTVITSNPSLVQGVGARMNGIFYTSAIEEVTREIGERGGHVLYPKTAKIDQISGLKKAIELMYRKIAVTINGFAGEGLSSIKEIEEKTDASITSLVICTTGVTKSRAEEIEKYADIVWSCASIQIREIVGKEALVQIGVKIPVYVLTQKGIDFVSKYSSKEFKENIEIGKKYLISGDHRMVINPRRIKMGDFETYIGEVIDLPVRVEDEPKPLV
jgi:putative methanogenesis marker protein 8